MLIASIAILPCFFNTLSTVVTISSSLLGAISYRVLNEIFNFFARSDIVENDFP